LVALPQSAGVQQSESAIQAPLHSLNPALHDTPHWPARLQVGAPLPLVGAGQSLAVQQLAIGMHTEPQAL
jgi:hypothetical protein